MSESMTSTITPEIVQEGSPTTPAPDAQMTSARATWIAAGHDAKAFDEAIKADGYAPIEAPAPELVAHYKEHGLPLEPKPASYSPAFDEGFAADKTPEHLAKFNAEMTDWAAGMGFSAPTGNAVIEHLTKVAPQVSRMSAEEQATWKGEQERLALRVVGTEEALAAHRERARAALGMVKGELGQALAKSPVLDDFFLTLTLSNHAERLALAAASRPKGRQ